MEEGTKTWLEKLPIITATKNLIIKYYVGDKIECICLGDVEHMKISFDKGLILVSNESSVIFACKVKDFISLWL